PGRLGETERIDPAPDVSDRDPGGDRGPRDRARNDLGTPEGRDREVLRRRHLAEAAAPGKTERKQATDEADRHRPHPAGRLPGRPQGGAVAERKESRTA